MLFLKDSFYSFSSLPNAAKRPVERLVERSRYRVRKPHHLD
jgi:hypothetical protein